MLSSSSKNIIISISNTLFLEPTDPGSQWQYDRAGSSGGMLIVSNRIKATKVLYTLKLHTATSTFIYKAHGFGKGKNW